MVLFLSTGLIPQLVEELLAGGAYTPDTPAAIVYKASWPQQKLLRCTLGTLARTAAEAGVRSTALVLVGDFLAQGGYQRSKLYDPAFTTGFREASR